MLISFRIAWCPLLGCPRYAVVILAHPHPVLVDQLAPEVAGEPDERRAQRGEGQGCVIRLAVLAAQKARYVASDKGRVGEPVVEGQPADGPVLYLVVVQYPCGGGTHRSHHAELYRRVPCLAQSFFIEA